MLSDENRSLSVKVSTRFGFHVERPFFDSILCRVATKGHVVGSSGLMELEAFDEFFTI